MTMITPSYLGETIEYSSLHACRSTLEDPTGGLELPRTEDASARELTLPMFGHLQPEQIERVVAALADELGRR